MPSYDRRNYIVASLALLVSVGSAVLAYYGMQASWQIAQESGSLDKATLEVGIGEIQLIAGKDNFVLVGAPELSTGTIPVIGAIPFTFRSSGKKSLDTLLVAFQYHELFNRATLEAMESKVSGAYSAVELKRTTSSESKRFFVSYSLGILNPGVTLRVSEPIVLEETKIRDEVPVTTKDGVNLIIPFEATFTKKFGLVASARDTQVVGYSISISVDRANSLEALLKSHQLKSHVSRRQQEVRRELSWPAYFAALITSSPKEQATLVYVALTKVEANDKVIYGPTPRQEVGQVQFEVLRWTLLFGGDA